MTKTVVEVRPVSTDWKDIDRALELEVETAQDKATSYYKASYGMALTFRWPIAGTIAILMILGLGEIDIPNAGGIISCWFSISLLVRMYRYRTEQRHLENIATALANRLLKHRSDQTPRDAPP